MRESRMAARSVQQITVLSCCRAATVVRHDLRRHVNGFLFGMETSCRTATKQALLMVLTLPTFAACLLLATFCTMASSLGCFQLHLLALLDCDILSLLCSPPTIVSYLT